MKNSKKGFAPVVILIIVVAVLFVGGGIYVYESKKSEVPVVVDTETSQTNQVKETTTQNPSVNNTQQNSQSSEAAITYASANLSATPATGLVPLTVNFEGQIKVPYNERARAIMFFGDGVSDVMFRSGPDLFSEKWTHTFIKSGEYDVIMVLTSVQDVDSDIQVMKNPYYSKNLVVKKVHIVVNSSPVAAKKSYCTPENYTVKSGVEYWGANPMQADPSTFKVLPRFPDDGGFDLCLSQDANNLFSAERIVAPRPQSVTYLSLQGTKNCKVYRVVGGVGVFHGVFLLAGSDAQTFMDLTPADGEKQGMCYGKDKNQVYSAYGVGGFGPIVGADPQTFKILNANYTKDANHVWNRGNPISNADTATFIVSGELWAKDKNNVYHWDKIISGADTTTFVALDDDHGKDAIHAFDPFGNVFSQIADVSSLTSVNGFWLKDKFHVYTSNGQILDQADSITFADLGSGYGRDVSHIFYGNTGTFGSGKGNIIPEADLTSFIVVADNYGKDNAHIFSIGKVLSGADVNTFARVGESTYFKDKSHVWYRGDGPGGLTFIPEADSTTFVLTDSYGYGGAKDANHTYGFSAKGFFYVK